MKIIDAKFVIIIDAKNSNPPNVLEKKDNNIGKYMNTAIFDSTKPVMKNNGR
jgi:hypothetical protein